jgi:DNA-binding MarR family transcriptional regulator
MDRPVSTDPADHPSGATPGADGIRPSDDALEIGRLVLELIHAAYATSEGGGEPAVDASGDRGHGHTDRRVVSPHAIRAAIHVYQHGERTVGELADGLGISMGWASRVVRELESSGMVVRATDPADRRVVRVTLTPEAIDVVERAYRWRADAIDRALAPLDDDGREAVRTFLRATVDELTRVGRERRTITR